MDRLAVTAGMHQPLRAQAGQLLADRCLTRAKPVFQFSHGFLARGQMAQNHQPPLMRERFQKGSGFGGAFAHLIGGQSGTARRIIDLIHLWPPVVFKHKA